MFGRLVIAGFCLLALVGCEKASGPGLSSSPGANSTTSTTADDGRLSYAEATETYSRIIMPYDQLLARLRTAATNRDVAGIKAAAANLSTVAQGASVEMLQTPWPTDLQSSAEAVANLFAGLITPYDNLANASNLVEYAQAIQRIPSDDAAFQIMNTKLQMGQGFTEED